MKKANTNSLESIIAFLEADNYRHRTGYAKEYCWNYLRRVELTNRQQQRIREVALRYLKQRMQREFWYMCRFIHRIADDAFRGQVEQLMKVSESAISKRASLLNVYLRDPEEGERMRKRFSLDCLREKHAKQSN